MTGWEGQVLAIALKELLEALRTLGRGGFGSDRALLSTVIRDLLTENPNLTRAEATLKAVEALGRRPSADFFVAKSLLAAVQKRRLLEKKSGPAGVSLTGSSRPSCAPRPAQRVNPPSTAASSKRKNAS